MTANRPPPFDTKQVSLLWAGPERAAEIAGMHARMFEEAWDHIAVIKMLEHPASTGFVCQIGIPKITVGFIMGQVMADEAEILSTGVAPELQRRGLGALLVGGFTRAAKRAEAKRVFLDVAADNAAGLALYTKLGFTEQSRRKAYYPRKGAEPVDAIVMSVPV